MIDSETIAPTRPAGAGYAANAPAILGLSSVISRASVVDLNSLAQAAQENLPPPASRAAT
jgi:hypothetical protein